MAVLLSQLYTHIKGKYNISVISGESGLNSPVKWVCAIENFNFQFNPQSGILAITEGIMFAQDKNMMSRVTELLVSGKFVGLAIILGRYITQEDISETVKSKCDEWGLPIFALGEETSVSDLTYDCSHFLMQREEHEMNVIKAFRNILFYEKRNPSAMQYLERHGYSESGKYYILYGGFVKKIPDELLQSDIEKNLNTVSRHFCLFIQDCAAVCIVYEDESEQIAKILFESMNSKGCASVGISEVCFGFDNLANAYKQAKTAQKAANIASKEILYFKDAGMYRFLSSVENTKAGQDFVDDILGKIKNFDAVHKTDYLKTLRAYIKCDGSVKDVADTCGVHRNTVNYKMRFIRQEFGFDFSYENIAALYTAFMLDGLRNE